MSVNSLKVPEKVKYHNIIRKLHADVGDVRQITNAMVQQEYNKTYGTDHDDLRVVTPYLVTYKKNLGFYGGSPQSLVTVVPEVNSTVKVQTVETIQQPTQTDTIDQQDFSALLKSLTHVHQLLKLAHDSDAEKTVDLVNKLVEYPGLPNTLVLIIKTVMDNLESEERRR